MTDPQTFLGQTVGPFTWQQLVTGLGIIVVAFIVRAIVSGWIARRLVALAERTQTESDDVAARALVTPLGWVLPVIGIYLALRVLAAGHDDLLAIADKVFLVAITLVVMWTVFKFIDAWAILAAEQSARSRTPIDNSLIPTLRKAFKAFTAVVVFVVVVQNLGYSVSGLLGALGVGGLAMALAAKDTLANLFGGITILVDRPFRVGDWITLTGADGTVEEIGLRSTRIRTFAKTRVSIPNSTLANATVENHSLMPRRRIKFTVGVTYSTTPDRMRELVRRIEEHLRANEDIHQEFLMVKFTEFGASSLDLLVYCFTVTTDWVAHLQARQEVQLAVMDIVEDLGLEIAFPTQTVHLATGEAPAGEADVQVT
ncbi:mechanosensitive ion channel [bacterium]|nr:mechanosensitive ion channel [bacterium]